MYTQQIPWTVNYDRDEMPPYSLPELMRCFDGTPVNSVEIWEKKRRPELLKAFQDEMYGATPPIPKAVRYELLGEKRDAVGGLAVRHEIRMHFTGDSGRTHSADMMLFVPARAAGRVPVFVGLTFLGNHVVTDDPSVHISGLKGKGDNPDFETRGSQMRRFPLDFLMKHGYALAVASYNDFFPDNINGWSDSIYELWYTQDELRARPRNASSIGAWSWGISRMLDCLETIPEIDGTNAAVYGHSRLGKTALWTGVRDTRFKLACVNDSGCGGAALNRRLYGETLFSMTHNSQIGLYWFTDTLPEKALHPESLAVEQHELIALMAPRAVAVHSATEDQWADPESEYLSAYHAGPAFALYGKTPLASAVQPPPDTPVGTDVSYFLRTGKHDILLADWELYVAMADRVMKP